MIRPTHERGGRTSSRTRVGMRWTRAASARRQSQGGSNRERCALRTTNDAGAYGKTVWSWLSLLQSSFREGASAQPGAMRRQFAKRRRQERIRLRGEHGISRQTTAQGRPGCLGCPVFPLCIACAMFSTGAMGASRRPVFPAPSVTKEGKETRIARAEHAARMRTHVRCLKF